MSHFSERHTRHDVCIFVFRWEHKPWLFIRTRLFFIHTDFDKHWLKHALHVHWLTGRSNPKHYDMREGRRLWWVGRKDEEPYDNKGGVFLFFLQAVPVVILNGFHELICLSLWFVVYRSLSVTKSMPHTPWCQTAPVCARVRARSIVSDPLRSCGP